MPYEAMSAETVLMHGHEGDLIDAYLARPSGPGPHSGVVVIHHMPGWDEATKEIARKFAHHGYIAISPNLHCREGKGTPEENSASVRAAGGMPDERTMGDVEGAIAYLRTLPYLNGKVGIIGYCSGGRQVYLAACTLRGIDAAIDCYGGGVVAKPE
jgi:carboxymethylenebutenolidase